MPLRGETLSWAHSGRELCTQATAFSSVSPGVSGGGAAWLQPARRTTRTRARFMLVSFIARAYAERAISRASTIVPELSPTSRC
jgi:hypothetical protein